MKALLVEEYTDLDGLKISEQSVPEPGADEVVIKVAAAALNFPDLLIIGGKYQVKPPLPFTPGMELSGVVSAIGDNVSNLKLGDRVAAVITWGAFAEYAVVPDSRINPIPEDMDFDIAASFGLAYLTSYHGLKNRAQISSGETLLVLGASGGVGLAAVDIGKAMGAHVIAVASSAEKLASCAKYGADEMINYKETALRDALKERPKDRPIDVVLDPVGGDLAETSFRSLGWRGRYLTVGFAAGDIPKLPMNLALLSERSLMGVYVGDYGNRFPEKRIEMAQEISALIEKGELSPTISQTCKFDNIVDAMRQFEARSVIGKIVIDIDMES